LSRAATRGKAAPSARLVLAARQTSASVGFGGVCATATPAQTAASAAAPRASQARHRSALSVRRRRGLMPGCPKFPALPQSATSAATVRPWFLAKMPMQPRATVGFFARNVRNSALVEPSNRRRFLLHSRCCPGAGSCAKNQDIIYRRRPASMHACRGEGDHAL